MADAPDTQSLIDLTADIVSAYVANNQIEPGSLASLIDSVHGSLVNLATGKVEEPAPALHPAVPVRRSVAPDYIICLEDGRKFKSLKRHLRTAYGLTPEEYRAKWGLPSDYPMVAPNYSASRSALAKSMGLGQPRYAEAEEAAPKARRAKASA